MLESAGGRGPHPPPSAGDHGGFPSVPDRKPRALVATKASDIHALDTTALVDLLESRAKDLYETPTKEAERRSWSASIKTVTSVLLEAGLGDVYVLLEMSALTSAKRVDMVLVGSHPRSGEISLVVVENKQWSYMRPHRRTGLVDHPGAPTRGSVHPLEQAWDYGMNLTWNLPILDDRWTCVANLHNAPPARIADPPAPAHIDLERAKMFGSGPEQRRGFVEFLTSVICAERAATHLQTLKTAHVRPSEELMRLVNTGVRARGGFFPLLHEQREAFRHIVHVVDQKFSANDKNVFIVVGGPGTGKSVLALELLGHLNGLGSPTVHASGSSAFANALRYHVSGDRDEVAKIFTYFNQHRHRPANHLNVILCDEAHRLRKDSNTQYMAKEDREDTPQVDELIQAARVPVFFLDPYQLVRNEEVGTPDTIRRAAIALGIREENIHEIDLKTQFRQSSCPEYLAWLEDLLGYHDARPRPWNHQGPFQFLLAESPEQMESYLRLRVALGHTARMTAGYCWPWSKKTDSEGELVQDIQIGDWRYPWNSAVPRKGIPGTDTWATDPRGLNQVGCVYTAQGLEWDYSGVIMGHDYTWTGSGWRARRGNDRKIWGRNLRSMVRNVYRVLATRGRDGVVLYSTDATTRRLFASLGVPPLAPALRELRERHPDAVVPQRAQRLTLF